MRDAPDQAEPITGNIYTIPPDFSFTDTLAETILSGQLPSTGGDVPDALSLVDWTILVPTRRAARALTMAFLSASGPGTRLLPRIRPLGDVDEDDLAAEAILGGVPELDLPPAIGPYQRQFVLAQLVLGWAHEFPHSELSRTVRSATGQALEVARSLGKLIDGFDNDEVSLGIIAELFGDDLPEHKQDVLGFLDVIRVKYPGELNRLGLWGMVRRRSALIRAQALALETLCPENPVIAAGSTGSIPATAELLAQISRLPLGAVVLPGLDLDMDDVSWEQLEQQHPQFGLKALLQSLNTRREDVVSLTNSPEMPTSVARRWFMSETMRPSATSDLWHGTASTQSNRLRQATDGLTWIEAPDQHAEARIIALIVRRALDDRERTVQLVTPDRNLARQVKAELGRWSIEVDDSAGEPSLNSPSGAFLALLADAAMSGFASRPLMALLDHPYALLGLARTELSVSARLLDVAVLRGRYDTTPLANLADDARQRHEMPRAHAHPLVKNMGDEDWQRVIDLAERLQSLLDELQAIFAAQQPYVLNEFLSAHILAAQAVTTDPDTGETPLWCGDAGEALAAMLDALAEHGTTCPVMLSQDYVSFVKSQLISTPVRPKHVRHPRIAIHGLLEARLISADVTILGGLNEGVWPGEAEIDPWLSRPQRRTAQLQLPERKIGLTAHDFVQAACGREVWLTTARKIDGQPAVPSRWILRMMAILQAAGLKEPLAATEPWLGWAYGLDEPGEHAPVKPPRPMPPVEARPTRLSVTAIDRLMKDPYGTYAKHVLKLEPLESLDAQVGARERGILVHDALQRFAEIYAGPLPAEAEKLLLAEIEKVFREVVADPSLAAFWWPQMERIAAWYIQQEHTWRQDAKHQYAEFKGLLSFDVAGRPFTLSGIADRIDLKTDGTLRLIDYKTGQLPAVRPESAGYSPQLDLESHMAATGAFDGIAAAPVSETVYVRLSGGDPGGELQSSNRNLAQRAQETFDGLLQLLTEYAAPTQPFLAINAADREDRPFDFDHLSRWREWGHLLKEDDTP